MTFNYFQTERNHDYVMVYDGIFNSSHLLSNTSGVYNSGLNTVISRTDQMLVILNTDSSVEFTGFQASYTAPVCWAELTDANGKFASPNYPDAYDTYLNCFWRITVNKSAVISLSFDTLSLDESSSLKVFNGPNNLSSVLLYVNNGFTAGSKLTFISTANQILVVFNSSWNNAQGFHATYNSIDPTTVVPPDVSMPLGNYDVCGGTYLGANTIYSPNYPLNYPNRLDCYWYLESNNADSVYINFPLFYTMPHNDFVTVYNGWSIFAPVLVDGLSGYLGDTGRWGGYSSTSTNKLLVYFHSDVGTTWWSGKFYGYFY